MAAILFLSWRVLAESATQWTGLERSLTIWFLPAAGLTMAIWLGVNDHARGADVSA
jgi:hypothetical protein